MREPHSVTFRYFDVFVYFYSVYHIGIYVAEGRINMGFPNLNISTKRSGSQDRHEKGEIKIQKDG